MMRAGSVVGVALCFWFAGAAAVLAADGEGTLKYKEVYELVREHLGGETEAEIDEAAARGLIEQLSPRVALVEGAGDAVAEVELVDRTAVYDRAFGYVRIRRVSGELGTSLKTAIEGLLKTNALKGLVLDLRYAGGEDYAGAAAAADLFFGTKQPMIDYGEGMKQAAVKTDAVTVPLAVLVNRETAAGAEAMAGILKSGKVGLLLGQTTSGHAGVFREFKLETGQTLRVASGSIKLGDGTDLAWEGLTPDITVEPGPDGGRAYYEDPYANLTGRSGEPRRRMNEAELVRRMREGPDSPVEAPAEEERDEAAPRRRILRDPVLGRAIDLLKGIAVVRQFQPN